MDWPDSYTAEPKDGRRARSPEAGWTAFPPSSPLVQKLMLKVVPTVRGGDELITSGVCAL